MLTIMIIATLGAVWAAGFVLALGLCKAAAIPGVAAADNASETLDKAA